MNSRDNSDSFRRDIVLQWLQQRIHSQDKFLYASLGKNATSSHIENNNNPQLKSSHFLHECSSQVEAFGMCNPKSSFFAPHKKNTHVITIKNAVHFFHNKSQSNCSVTSHSKDSTTLLLNQFLSPRRVALRKRKISRILHPKVSILQKKSASNQENVIVSSGFTNTQEASISSAVTKPHDENSILLKDGDVFVSNQQCFQNHLQQDYKFDDDCHTTFDQHQRSLTRVLKKFNNASRFFVSTLLRSQFLLS
jgi:hypothetical protein